MSAQIRTWTLRTTLFQRTTHTSTQTAAEQLPPRATVSASAHIVLKVHSGGGPLATSALTPKLSKRRGAQPQTKPQLLSKIRSAQIAEKDVASLILAKAASSSAVSMNPLRLLVWTLKNLFLSGACLAAPSESKAPTRSCTPLMSRLGNLSALTNGLVPDIQLRHALDVVDQLNAFTQAALHSIEAGLRHPATVRLGSIEKGTLDTSILTLLAPGIGSSYNLHRGAVVFLGALGKISPSFFGIVSDARLGKDALEVIIHLPREALCTSPVHSLKAWFCNDINTTSTFAILDALLKFDDIVKPGPLALALKNAAPISTTHLTDSQSLAIETSMKNTVSVIWGPPGSGKSHTTAELISALLSNPFNASGSRSTHAPGILVTAPSHQSLDVLLSKLLTLFPNDPRFTPGKLFRIGRADQTDPELHKFLHADSKRVHFAPLVFATTLGCGVGVLAQRAFDTVVVDEAGQVGHMDALVPLVKAQRRVVLVGDPRQLGVPGLFGLPVGDYKDTGAARGRASLLDWAMRMGAPRVGMECPIGGAPIVMLREQFRMHPELMEFSSKTWYGGEVRAHASARDLAALECKPFDGLRRVAFVDVDGKEEFCGRVESYRNLEEAERVASIVASMVRAGVCSLDVGVISGYSAQVELIRICLELEGLSDVDVRTVDGFQGQERKVIIFSGVRSKENLGFLSDHRRLNVMLTRAKQGLVVVGRRRTLELDSVWRDWLTSMNA